MIDNDRIPRIMPGMSPISGDYYTTVEAAALTGTTTDLWVKRCAGTGGMARIDGAVKVGHSWLIPAAAVDGYIANRPPRGRPRKERNDAEQDKPAD